MRYSELLFRIYNNDLNQREEIHNADEIDVVGYNIPTLISFFRWCGTQENINYPKGWGKDLSFSRYFEDIYAGYIQSEDLLESIRVRTNKRGGTTMFI